MPQTIENDSLRRVLIIGAGATGKFLCKTLLRQRPRKYHIAGFVDDNPDIVGTQIQGIKAYGPTSETGPLITKLDIQQIIIAMPTVPANRVHAIIDSTKGATVSISTIPSYLELIEGKNRIDNITNLKVEDVIQREKLEVDIERIAKQIAGKTVLITGAAGSIGSELSRQILNLDPATLILVDHAESPLFYLEQELLSQGSRTQIVPAIANIANGARMMSLFGKYRPHSVFHAAAYKHVPLMEGNFEESITNNVLGTKNVADVAHMFQAEQFVKISTDKAVHPTCIMGLTKRVAEVYIQSLNQTSKTRFMTVRLGNVFDSTGNVIQVFKQQIRQGGPVTVTHPEMRRNFITISDAVKLILEAGLFGRGGEIFAIDMGEPVRILDVAKAMIQIAGYELGKDIDIVFTGMRPGEKLVEEHVGLGENTTRTAHPRIFMRTSPPKDWATVRTKVNDIINSVYHFDRGRILAKIMDGLVPEFKGETSACVEEPYEEMVIN